MANLSKTYTNPGYYLITLSVKDSVGCVDYASEFVQIGSANCKADFTYIVDAINLKLDLESKSIGAIKNHYWSFGNGKSATTNLAASNTYDEAGMYNVSLTISDSTATCADFKS